MYATPTAAQTHTELCHRCNTIATIITAVAALSIGLSFLALPLIFPLFCQDAFFERAADQRSSLAR